jgi:DNA polymerase/3'-5' exonuclease PolX
VKQPIPLAVAKKVAEDLTTRLRCYPDLLTRVEVAGSIRRQKPQVGDIEIVAQAARQYAALPMRIVLERSGVDRGTPNKAGAKAPWGEKYYRGEIEVSPGLRVGLDLFVVTPPAEWGVLHLIRTGSAEFSQSVVTRLHNWGLQSVDGHIIRKSTGEVLPCSHESVMFRYARLPWIPPVDRDVTNAAFKVAFSREWQPGEELPRLARVPEGVPA